MKGVQTELQELKTEKNRLKNLLKAIKDEEAEQIKNKILDINQKIEAVSAPIRDFDKKFPTLYAELTSKSLAASMEGREEIKGQWVKYEQGESGAAETLYQSLAGKGTGWCTAGRSTAETQIERGDFYVYYTNDSHGEPTQPRLAIRMDGDNKIGEVRGVLPHQGVEPLMQEVLDEKLSEFGSEADTYRKKSEDMRMLTNLIHKQEKDESFTKDDLTFLYEIDSSIQGFGYKKDPRIAELRAHRNPETDMSIIFECTKEQIAHNVTEITEDTKAYVGKLEPGIFQKLPETIEYIYTSFPEKKFRIDGAEVGGKSKEELIADLKAQDFNISDYTYSTLDNSDFVVSPHREHLNLICLTVADLGFETDATTVQIFERAEALGLELCPPDTGPSYRLTYTDQPSNEILHIAMRPITDSDGNQIIYSLSYNLSGQDDGFCLYEDCATTWFEWSPRNMFVFHFRKREEE